MAQRSDYYLVMKFLKNTEAVIMLALAVQIVGLIPIQPVFGETAGVVCITDPAAASCESASPPPQDISQFELAVNIQDSAGLNGFDIYVKADPNSVIPIGLSLEGTLLGPNHIIAAKCVEFSGIGCGGTAGGSGVVRVAAVTTVALPAPVSGRLFSISYNLVSPNPSGIGFQTGCTLSSTSTNLCVVVVNGSQVVPVTVRPETSGPGDFAIMTENSGLIVRKGSVEVTSFTVVSLEGFFGGIGLEIALSPRRGRFTPQADFYVGTPSVFLLPGTLAFVLVQVSVPPRSPPGQYTITIVGTSGTLIHSSTFTVTVARV